MRPADVDKLLTTRRARSSSRIAELSRALKTNPVLKANDGVTVYAVGSYGRGEASNRSDLDLFVMQDDRRSPRLGQLQQMELFSHLVDVARSMHFPPFSNDGEYLKVHSLTEMCRDLGSAQDDTTNAFTARMLLLLESRPIVGAKAYGEIIAAILAEYWRDYSDHAADFRPIFLLNDVMRYWKTLCLNYESKRNEPEAVTAVDKAKQHRKDLKLKYSRLLICFGLVIPLATGRFRSATEVRKLLELTPLERLERAAGSDADAGQLVRHVKDSYVAFLKSDDDPDVLLRSLRRDATWRKEFVKGNAFAEQVFQLLMRCASTSGTKNFLRYVVV